MKNTKNKLTQRFHVFKVSEIKSKDKIIRRNKEMNELVLPLGVNRKKSSLQSRENLMEKIYVPPNDKTNSTLKSIHSTVTPLPPIETYSTNYKGGS